MTDAAAELPRGSRALIEGVRRLARSADLPITEDDVPEVAYRFGALMQEFAKLDWAGIPVDPALGFDVDKEK